MIWIVILMWAFLTAPRIYHLHCMAVYDSIEHIMTLYIEEGELLDEDSDELEIAALSWWMWKQANTKGIL